MTMPGKDKKPSFETTQQGGTRKSSVTTSTRNKVRAVLLRISNPFSHFDLTPFEICERFRVLDGFVRHYHPSLMVFAIHHHQFCSLALDTQP